MDEFLKTVGTKSVKESFGNNHEIFSATHSLLENLEKVARIINVVGHVTAVSVNNANNPGIEKDSSKIPCHSQSSSGRNDCASFKIHAHIGVPNTYRVMNLKSMEVFTKSISSSATDSQETEKRRQWKIHILLFPIRINFLRLKKNIKNNLKKIQMV